jgi:hypothetical protein
MGKMGGNKALFNHSRDRMSRTLSAIAIRCRSLSEGFLSRSPLCLRKVYRPAAVTSPKYDALNHAYAALHNG